MALAKIEPTPRFMAKTKCENCGFEIQNDASECPACGTPSAAPTNALLPDARKSDPKKPGIRIIGIITVCLLAGLLVAAWATTHKATPPATTAKVEEKKIDIDAVRTKAEAGDAQAQRDLGRMYARGQGVPESYAEAAKWYRKAADQGNAEAQAALGELHEAGQGVARDEKEAAKWYRRAAEQGLAAAQYNLAAMYVIGRGVPQSTVEALKWYRQAAEQGDALAQFNLGMRYYEANGVVADPVQAYQWLSLASAQGIPDATKARADLKGKMTSAQIAEAERRVSAFVVKKTGR